MNWILLGLAALACMVAIVIALVRRRPRPAIVAAEDPAPARIGRRVPNHEAVEQERQRLYADLHDDIGAKLVTLIHSLDNAEHADLARSVLQDLRDIVSRSNIGPLSLLEALAQIREEAEQRLACVHCTLDWQQGVLPDPALDESQVLHLFRISREAISNALRHGHATQLRMRVKCTGNLLLLDVTDDGPGLSQFAAAGRGTTNMKQRADALHGSINWTPGTEGGTKVVLQFPMPVA